MKKRKIQVVVVLFISSSDAVVFFFQAGRWISRSVLLCHAMGVDYENGEYNVSSAGLLRPRVWVLTLLSM